MKRFFTPKNMVLSLIALLALGIMAYYAYPLLDFVLHINQHLTEFTQKHSTLIYVLLFAIIFCETGLVVTPFLPGDSLLFAVGSLAGLGHLNIVLVIVLLLIAGILGDMVNFYIGKYFGNKMLEKQYIKQTHIDKTNEFYARYGGKTIILARFIPIVRTFAPFVAGLSKMDYKRFSFFNITGAVLWIFSLVGAGYFFGQFEMVKKNFGLIVIAIIIVSILPAVIEIGKHQINKRKNPV